MRFRVKGLTLLVLASLGCGLADADARAEPTGVTWRWVSLSGNETLAVARPGKYTLELHADGRYSARADCNQANGSYTMEGQRLTLGPAAATLAECGRDSHSTRFLRLLGRVEGYRRDGERLELTLADGAGALALRAARKVALADSSWVVRAVNTGKGGVVSVAIGTSLDASFAADGKVSGSAGCNRYHAGYELEGDSLAIGPAAATRRICGAPAGIMEQESAFLAALGTVAKYEIRGERLQLRSAQGSLAVDLVSAVAGRLATRGCAALPEGARVRLQLRDVSLQDVPSVLIGEQVFPLREEQRSLLFHVAYDPSDIDPRHSYAVNATVEDDAGRVLFRTTRFHPVITREQPTLGVALELDPAN